MIYTLFWDFFGSICLWHTKQKSQRVIFSQQSRPADKVHPLSAFFIIIMIKKYLSSAWLGVKPKRALHSEKNLRK